MKKRKASAMVTFVILASLMSAISVAYFLALQHISSIRPTAWDAVLRIHNAVEQLQKPPQSIGKSITIQLFIPEGSTLRVTKAKNGFTIIAEGVYGDLSYRFTDPAEILTDEPFELNDAILRVSYKTVKVVAGDVTTGSGDTIVALGPGRHFLVLTLVEINEVRIDEVFGGFGVADGVLCSWVGVDASGECDFGDSQRQARRARGGIEVLRSGRGILYDDD